MHFSAGARQDLRLCDGTLQFPRHVVHSAVIHCTPTMCGWLSQGPRTLFRAGYYQGNGGVGGVVKATLCHTLKFWTAKQSAGGTRARRTRETRGFGLWGLEWGGRRAARFVKGSSCSLGSYFADAPIPRVSNGKGAQTETLSKP